MFKAAQLRVLRNNFREMFVEITALGGKSAPLKLRLQRFAVHKKFVAEGKASIHFQDENCTVFMTNAPTGSLCAFLRLLIVKTSAAGTPVKPDFKKRLEAGTQFDEISPVTTLEMAKVKQRLQPTSKATTTTPSPPQAQKRPRVMDPMATPEAKKRVFKPSRLIEEPQQLNAEQKDVLQACLSGKNIFFTGETRQTYKLGISSLWVFNAVSDEIKFSLRTIALISEHANSLRLRHISQYSESFEHRDQCLDNLRLLLIGEHLSTHLAALFRVQDVEHGIGQFAVLIRHDGRIAQQRYQTCNGISGHESSASHAINKYRQRLTVVYFINYIRPNVVHRWHLLRIA